MQYSFGNGLIPVLRTSIFFAVLVRFSVLSQPCPLDLGCVPHPRFLLNNSFPQRTLIVSSTCGQDGIPTQYCTLSLPSCDARNAYTCDGTSPRHTPDLMFDRKPDPKTGTSLPDYTTYWQSANTVSGLASESPVPVFVTVDLADAFLVRRVTVVFVSPLATAADRGVDMRPTAVVFEARRSAADAWRAWRYYAADCARFYPGVLVQDAGAKTPTYGATTPVCIERYFAGDASTQTVDGVGIQGVTFNPAVEFDPDFLTSFDVQSFFVASAVRIRLDRPARTEPLLSYYAVAHLEVDGSCACFGHSVDCLGINEAECNCLHNTSGVNCDQCLPTYNNVPWGIGTPTDVNYCESCACNEFALSCHYDGAYGRGVCDNCTHHTTGFNCDFCVDFFYINPNRSASLPTDTCYGVAGTQSITYNCNEPCIPCDCNPVGTAELSQYNCANATGQCLCKGYVEGRACGQCRLGYWNLSMTNDFGCQLCDCNWFGTVNNSNACDTQSGSCLCKNNVLSPGRCDACKTGYFNLSADNVDGCESCGCDLGASLTGECSTASGACSCRSFISGRTCRDPFPGYFGPRLDDLTLEAESADNATAFDIVKRLGHGDQDASNTGIGFLRVRAPFFATLQFRVGATFLYDVILRYENTLVGFPGARVTIQLLNPDLEASVVYECGGANLSTAAPLQFPLDFPVSTGKGYVSAGRACLLSSPTAVYELRIDVTQTPIAADAYFLLDSVVLLPILDQIDAYVTADDAAKQLMTTCYNLARNVSNGQRSDNGCSAIDYSLMTNVYDGATACQCDPVGSQSFGCEPLGGQCYCKPNVILLDCSACRVDSYGFSTGLGCTRCECHPGGSVSPSCDESGVCTCRANVTGVRCDRCLDNYFGLQSGLGCSPCTCNTTYTMDGVCSDTGQCPCKPGVGGLACDQCDNHYFNLTTDGCTWCGCDVNGSQSASACNSQSGGCYCKANTVGLRCDNCQAGYYGLGPWAKEGCMPCHCSGRSSNCSSAAGWRYAVASSTWSLLTGSTATQAKWTGVDEAWNRFELPNPTLIGDGDASHVMRIANDATNIQSRVLYFLATDVYLGNKRGAYGQNFRFSLSLQVPAGIQKEAVYVSSTDGDVIIEGTSAPFTLVYTLANLPSTIRTNYTVKLQEDNFNINSTAGPRSTYAQLLLVLGSIKSIRIRAKYYNAVGSVVDLHSASLEYAVYDPSGVSPLVNNVEQCVCPAEYTGQFCELCAAGYTRLSPNGGLFTACVRCFCYNHDTEGTNCDPESGSCVCAHNTTGRQCEACLGGYYGYAVSGRPGACQPCLCPGNVAAGEPNVFAGGCAFSRDDSLEHSCINCSTGHTGSHCETCAENWFGTPLDPTNANGRCSPCSCYGRATTCNSTTGVCIGCSNNTTGRTCDECAVGYYGNPVISQCRPCSCTGVGMTGLCDSLTGQCDCQPYVTGFNCDRCQLYSYSSNITTNGCRPCNCSVQGSFGDPPGCNPVTGQCDCKAFVTGLQCNGCEDTYWNVGSEGCQSCDCYPVGTAVLPGQPFGKCDLSTGQCQCNDPAISGRRCDVCARATTQNFTYIYGLSIGVYPVCQLCGDCYDSVGKLVDSTAADIDKSFGQILQLWSNSYGNMTFDVVNSSMRWFNDTLMSFSSTLVSLTPGRQEIDAINSDWKSATDRYDWAYGNTTDAIAQSFRIQSATDSVRQWIDRSLIINGVAVPRGPELQSSLTVTKDRQDLIFSAATDAYTTVRRNINILNNSTGIVEMMRESVRTSMQLVDYSRQLRAAAVPRDDPARSLDAVQSVVNSAAGINDTVSTICSTINATLLQCLVYINQVDSLSGAAYNQTFNLLVSYQSLRTAATQAHDTATLAKNNADRLYNQSSAAKQGLTRSVESLALALTSMTSMYSAASTFVSLSSAIGAMQVAPLATIQDLARQVSAASVAPDAVARAATLANQYLGIANDVLRQANSSGTQAESCRQQLNNVTAQTVNATQQAQQADSQRYIGTDFISGINSIILSVLGKANNAVILADSTNSRVTNMLLLLSSLQSQFLGLPDRVRNARLSAEQSATRTGDWTAAFASIQSSSDALQVQLYNRSATVAQQATTAATARTQFLSFQSELSGVGLSQTVRSLNTELTTQLEDLKGLNRDLTYLQNQIVMMTILLDQLGGSSVTVTCNA